VAKQGDGWLSEGDGWLSWRGWAAELEGDGWPSL
jgi:hypothetical protein